MRPINDAIGCQDKGITMKEKLMKIILAILLVFTVFPHAVYADEEENESPEYAETVSASAESEEDAQTDEPSVSVEETIAETDDEVQEEAGEERYARTILMYLCGADLESGSAMATYNLEQILNSRFSNGDQVKFIIMTGGSDEYYGWHLPAGYLYDPSGSELQEIDTVYNCIWEAKGIDASQNPGKLVLLDGDGILGDGENAKRAKPLEDEEGDMIGSEDDYEWMSDPKVLKAFIDYGVANYPAESYDLILWDHGGGPQGGYGLDEHSGSMMHISEVIEAISDNQVIEEKGKFDIINFDACLMNSVELCLAMAPYTDYYIASPELVPGRGEYYCGWLDLLGEYPDMDGYDIGKRIVDDFLEFYEIGEGSGTEGTMAVINTKALMESNFLDDLIRMNDLMYSQLYDIMHYDELSSSLNSIHYGTNGYFVDLGNLAALLCVNLKEFDEDHIPSGGIDNEVNDYFDTAIDLMNILDNEEIIYNCSTQGIHTSADLLFRDRSGHLRFTTEDSPLRSSGMYIYFAAVNEYRETENYYGEMRDTLSVMPGSDARTFLADYLKTALLYSLMLKTGNSVTEMVNQDYEKEEISYDTVKQYWKYNKPEYEEYGLDLSQWSIYVQQMINRVLDRDPYSEETEPAEFIAWMELLIRQMADEAIAKKNIELFVVDHGYEEGYRVRINDTRKRVIDHVGYNLIAELPVLEQWLDDNNIRWLFLNGSTDMSIGYVSGSEVFDMDLDSTTVEDFMTDYVRWLNGNTATWDLNAIERKWYTISDAQGILHVVCTEPYNGYMLVPTAMDSGEVDEYGDPIIYMTALFFDGEDLVQFMIKEEGSYRPVMAKDLQRDLTLAPCMILDGFMSSYYAPISSEFTITPENVGQIKLLMTDVDAIEEIQDVSGDGEKLTKRIIITDIYGTDIDITELIDDPTGYLTDIRLADILDDEYTGEELSPRIVCYGKTLVEGVDYKLIKATDDTVFKEVDEYYVGIQGIGDYVGYLGGFYHITPPSIRYLIVSGANASWQKGSNKVCDFTFRRNFEDEKTFDLFDGILVDGRQVDASDYTYEKGSVVIHLMPSFLEKLSVGDHSITALFEDGRSEAIRFIVKAKPGDKQSSQTYSLPLTGVEQLMVQP